MTTEARASLLAEAASLFEPWTGPFSAHDLLEWLEAELGNARALDIPQRYGPVRSLACAPKQILHVLSQNTPHAAFQSLLRGLLLGSHNCLKLPSSDLPELTAALEHLHPALRRQIDIQRDLPGDWKERFETLVVFGRKETMDWFRQETPSHVNLLLHGPKLSVALVTSDPEAGAKQATHDISLFDQQGCLSIHNVYLHPASEIDLPIFADLLATEMEQFNAQSPRAPLPPNQSGVITSLREAVRFESASRPESVRLWASEGSTDWTVIMDADPSITVSPLNRVAYVKPWPADDLRKLGPERSSLASLALHPYTEETAHSCQATGATRICPLGETQHPPLFWHHDGISPLAALVTWLDFGPARD